MKLGTKVGIIYGVLGFPVPFKGGPYPLVLLLLAITKGHVDPGIFKAIVTVFNPVYGLYEYYNFGYIVYYSWLLILVPVVTAIAIAHLLNNLLSSNI